MFSLPGIKVQPAVCVQYSLLEFVFLISKLDYHPLNQMVIKPFVLRTLLIIDFSRTVINFWRILIVFKYLK